MHSPKEESQLGGGGGGVGVRVMVWGLRRKAFLCSSPWDCHILTTTQTLTLNLTLTLTHTLTLILTPTRPISSNSIIPAAAANGIVTPFPRAAEAAANGIVTLFPRAAAEAADGIVTPFPRAAAATAVDGASTASGASTNGRVLTIGGRALGRVVSDAVLISINFWGMGIRREGGRDGEEEGGLGLWLRLGGWGKVIRLGVRVG